MGFENLRVGDVVVRMLAGTLPMKLQVAETHQEVADAICNPKVPLSYVRQHGELLYSSLGEKMEDTVPAKPLLES